jgi:hypothetical protein
MSSLPAFSLIHHREPAPDIHDQRGMLHGLRSPPWLRPSLILHPRTGKGEQQQERPVILSIYTGLVFAEFS